MRPARAVQSQGFGGDRDAGTRIPVLIGYSLLCVACLVVSLVLAHWLAPHMWEWALVIYVVGVMTAVVVLGIFA